MFRTSPMLFITDNLLLLMSDLKRDSGQCSLGEALDDSTYEGLAVEENI